MALNHDMSPWEKGLVRIEMLVEAAKPSLMVAETEYEAHFLQNLTDEDRLEMALYRSGMTDPEVYGPLSGNMGNVSF